MDRIIRAGILVFASCIAASHTNAQSATRSTDTAKGKVQQVRQPVASKGPKGIRTELSAGIRLNTNGWSAFVDLGKVKPLGRQKDMFYRVRLMQLEFTEKKDIHEQKITAAVPGNSSGSPKYIYGKTDNFYALKLGVGSMRMIAGKPDPGAVSIHWLNAIGLSLGMLKPYYVNVPNAIKYSEAGGSSFLDKNVIQGSAGFSKGLGEMKYIPGGHIKSALHFDFSANRKSVIGAEAGINFEYYSQDISLIVDKKARRTF